MNHDASPLKRAATEAYGATVVSEGIDHLGRDEAAAEVAAERGYALIHPFDDWDVISGQGTATLELLEDAPPLDAVVTPLGGGGLLSGAALACAQLCPRRRSGAPSRPVARRACLAGGGPHRAPRGGARDDRRRRAHGGHREPATSRCCASAARGSPWSRRTSCGPRFALVWQRTKLADRADQRVWPIAALLAGRNPGAPRGRGAPRAATSTTGVLARAL